MYPNCSSLLTTFENKSDHVIKLLDEKLKDSTNRKLFDNLRDEQSVINQSNYYINNINNYHNKVFHL